MKYAFIRQVMLNFEIYDDDFRITGAVWNKGDGVAALVESLHDSLKVGKVCVAGDTASDVPMLKKAADENPEVRF